MNLSKMPGVCAGAAAVVLLPVGSRGGAARGGVAAQRRALHLQRLNRRGRGRRCPRSLTVLRCGGGGVFSCFRNGGYGRWRCRRLVVGIKRYRLCKNAGGSAQIAGIEEKIVAARGAKPGDMAVQSGGEPLVGGVLQGSRQLGIGRRKAHSPGVGHRRNGWLRLTLAFAVGGANVANGQGGCQRQSEEGRAAEYRRQHDATSTCARAHLGSTTPGIANAGARGPRRR